MQSQKMSIQQNLPMSDTCVPLRALRLLNSPDNSYFVTTVPMQRQVYVCERAYLRKVVSQQLLDGRGLENINAHAGNVRHRLRPAVKLPDLSMGVKLCYAGKQTWSLAQTRQLLRQDFASTAGAEATAMLLVFDAKHYSAKASLPNILCGLVGITSLHPILGL